MNNIASILKSEITRLARKEVRSETDQIRKAVAHYRSEIATLKRQNAELSKRLSVLEKQSAQPAQPGPAGSASDKQATGTRFRADGLRKHRERLGLSAPALASILGVSAQTIYNWESKATRPNVEQLAKIAMLRKMGKREVQQRLAQVRES